jgi:hypothetical protein
MNVVGVNEYGNDFCYAVLKQQSELDPEFTAAARKLDGWETIDDDELLDAQTFVSWYQNRYPKASIEEALNNELFSWQGLPLLGDEEQDDEE